MGRQRTGGVIIRDGAYYARVTYVDELGRRREMTRKALDRADAQRIIAELHERIDRHGGEAALNDRSAFAEVLERYRTEKAQPAVIRDGKKIAGQKSHYETGIYLDVISRYLGKKKLRDIKPGDLQAFKRARLSTPTKHGKERTVAAVNRELECLRAVLRWAVKQGWLARSPFEFGETVIHKGHEASRDRVLTHDEEERLLAACTGRRAHLRAIITMAVDTAMRMGELLLLCWRHVDFLQGVINLPGEITKTGKPRVIPITPRLNAELETLWAKSKPGADDLVFNARSFKEAWKRALEAAGITGLKFHDLRHSGITRMIAANINPALVMKISGHDSMRTFQRYLNPQADTLREAAERLHDLNAAQRGRVATDDQGDDPQEYVN